MKKKIFITGSTGCIGHYVLDEFIDNPDYELHLLLREPSRLMPQYQNHPCVKLHQGNMEDIEQMENIIKEADYLIHIATDWSNSDYAVKLNVEKTEKMFSFCDPNKIKKIVYFSTASILGPDNKPVKEAETIGPGYVRSKYLGYHKIKKHQLAKKITTVFPTIVFGGDKNHPYSHISSGIIPNQRYLKILRFFYIDAKFHFLHSKDIATITKHLLLNETSENEYVLGTKVLTGKQTIETLCEFFKIPIYFRIKVPLGFVFFLANIFKIEIDPWTKYCLKNPFFEYKVVNPSDFGLKTTFPTLESVLQNLNN
ncbi:NAD-dependent epimerase/dehydratase family protein [Candidatus Margulisiibacteriota bacterium]